ncbi:MAG: tetratricopeptide repeat protein [Candidatus Omnitrophota bacterium]
MNNNNYPLAADIEELYQKGLSALKKNNFDYAVELFGQTLEHRPGFTPALNNLWKALREKRKISPASKIQAFLAAAKTLFLSVNFKCLLLLDKTDKAIAVQQQIICLSPESAAGYYNLAVVYIRQKKNEKAKDVLEQILFLEKKNANALRRLAHIYFEQKDYRKSQAMAKSLLSIKPGDLEAENILKDIAALGAIEKGFDNIRPAT